MVRHLPSWSCDKDRGDDRRAGIGEDYTAMSIAFYAGKVLSGSVLYRKEAFAMLKGGFP